MLNKNIPKVFSSIKYSQALVALNKNLAGQYLASLYQTQLPGKHILVLPIWGIGDELMVCGIYQALQEIVHNLGGRLSIASDPRLVPLFKRSYEHLNFISVKRKHRGAFIDKLSMDELKSPLPDSGLYFSFDSDLWSTRGSFDGFMPLPLAVHELLKQTDIQKNSHSLIPDPRLKQMFTGKLSQLSSKPKVGIVWKSNLLGEGRSVHYTNLKDWSPVLKSKNELEFISLQYGDVNEEIDQVMAEHELVIHRITEFDAYNDLDTLAALIAALDIVISPSSVIAELAGAVNTKIIFMLNSAEGEWRKTKDNKDLWHTSMSIVTPDKFGDKVSLLKNTSENLIALIDDLKPDAIRAN